LNHRHTDFQSVALPTELPGRTGEAHPIRNRLSPVQPVWPSKFIWATASGAAPAKLVTSQRAIEREPQRCRAFSSSRKQPRGTQSRGKAARRSRPADPPPYRRWTVSRRTDRDRPTWQACALPHLWPCARGNSRWTGDAVAAVFADQGTDHRGGLEPRRRGCVVIQRPGR
jgi:hypothetical protein